MMFYKLGMEIAVVKYWNGDLRTRKELLWYLHYIINTQFSLTTKILKQIKQSIKFNNIIMRWYLFSKSRQNIVNKKSTNIVNY
ncbi:30S ribosomal subunit protein S6 [Candidatus Hodgkinia cicadicola]|uniref:30S ribosomal subunit protein S6 n=1 Tax=Candidatus Hodgkinia cicadicola TaxID=573658 RepID=A0ABX4MH50_9HYPH|nr:30S ribosomal subunit protein S6 [Candidatus Hodgkinia cicadicola]